MKNAVLVGVGLGLGFLAAVAMPSNRAADASGQAGPGGGGGAAGVTILGTGGASQNQNDLCWVLAKVQPAKGPQRTVLAMYRAKKNGDYFDLEDVRAIDADLRVVELKVAEHKKAGTDVPTIMKALPPPEREALLPPREPGERPENR